MEHAKKMVLIPSEAMERFQRNNIRQVSELSDGGGNSGRVSSDPITRLDSEMQSILNQSSKDDAEKWKLYQQILQRYLHFTEESRKPLRLEVHSQPGDTPSEKTDSVEPISGEKLSKVLATIPKTYQSKGELLLRHLTSNPKRFSWDANGVVSIDGAVIQGSNIVDLVNDGVRQRKGFHASGRHAFARYLGSINTPQEYIGNPELRKGLTALSSPATISPATPATSSGRGRQRYDAIREEVTDSEFSSAGSSRADTSERGKQERKDNFYTPKRTHSSGKKGRNAAEKSKWMKLKLAE